MARGTVDAAAEAGGAIVLAVAVPAGNKALGAAAVQFDTAPRDFILNADSACLRDPVATDQMVARTPQIHATTLVRQGSWRVREAVTTSPCNRRRPAQSEASRRASMRHPAP